MHITALIPSLTRSLAWVGEPTKALIARETIKVIREQDLVQKTAQVGSDLYKALKDMAKSGAGAGKMSSVRGQGTFLAFDMPDAAQRDAFVGKMRSKGVNMVCLHFGEWSSTAHTERSGRLRRSVCSSQANAGLWTTALGYFPRQGRVCIE